MIHALARSFVTVMVIWCAGVLSPGPNLCATVSASSLHSRKAGLALASGIALGTCIWCIIIFLGFGLLFKTGGLAFDILKLLGGGYLCYLGTNTMLTRNTEQITKTNMSLDKLSLKSAFWKGVALDLTNPTAALFFTSLFATNLPQTSPFWFKLIILLSITAIAGSWYALVANIVSRPNSSSMSPAIKTFVSMLCGMLLLTFGLIMLAELLV